MRKFGWPVFALRLPPSFKLRRDKTPQVYNTYLEGIETIIQHGIATGEFRDVDPDEAAYGLMALIEGMVMYRNIGFRPLSPQNYRTVCKDFARRYLSNR